ncbi:hypothetical protein [Listeria newyorkensis]|uniref:Uncharacterized protein n=1 Tax=Listeria newyorkensis TaxID=1497681 RepID=A0A841Z2J4_9LIST|nr:hypothetical protein [Listeria newyorkensis]MBC1459053.1 hypothetical protein [Listeria newyorkensis]
MVRRNKRYKILIGGYVSINDQQCAFSIAMNVSKAVIGGTELRDIQKRIAREFKTNQDVAITSISKLNIK